jgi:hypothetical protein
MIYRQCVFSFQRRLFCSFIFYIDLPLIYFHVLFLVNYFGIYLLVQI